MNEWLSESGLERGLLISDNSHTTSSDGTCEVESPSLLAEEDIVPLKPSPFATD
ncbi:hypothetical protein CY34DRAFT_805255 [Suillus luteus UH-Slu-Lm8-n1]|uniref:Uncharacterized protein n=1 Tax=Suillus luteus UH-Slu-Lm8-n1 TaxID=930992 RepID=A0A0D0BFQ9_9AGAM|nr:hypothetical protein CY34DRAFT_805255 [Suillus luteus UH-Slu-Lm8-n1]